MLYILGGNTQMDNNIHLLFSNEGMSNPRGIPLPLILCVCMCMYTEPANTYEHTHNDGSAATKYFHSTFQRSGITSLLKVNVFLSSSITSPCHSQFLCSPLLHIHEKLHTPVYYFQPNGRDRGYIKQQGYR